MAVWLTAELVSGAGVMVIVVVVVALSWRTCDQWPVGQQIFALCSLLLAVTSKVANHHHLRVRQMAQLHLLDWTGRWSRCKRWRSLGARCLR